MTKEEQLVSMLQPKNYKSKLKLYCEGCKVSLNLIEVFVPKCEESRLKQIKIEEL